MNELYGYDPQTPNKGQLVGVTIVDVQSDFDGDGDVLRLEASDGRVFRISSFSTDSDGGLKVEIEP